MSSTNEGKLEVYAWVSAPKQAEGVTEEHIEDLRNALGESLAVERRTDGSLVLYTSDEAMKVRLDAMMRVLGLFREQRIYVSQAKE